MGGSYGTPGVNVAAETQGEPEVIVDSTLPRWFAVHTRYRFEKKVVDQLTHKRCEAYLPLRTERHAWSDREKAVTTPLFPGYAFVHIDQSSESRRAVLQTAGLMGFVSFGGTATPVPSAQIEHLQLLLREKVPFSLHPFVHAGQRVRIRGGCLHGVEGVLLQHKGKLVISVESIQRSLAMEIQGYELDLV
jgi:transcription antitermination factor NusG